MPDREKVIKGLECCMKWTGEPNTATCHCSDCSYTNMDILGQRCLIDLINDALALLKEQGDTINELQNAYVYLQKQFFEVQDKLLKEQEKRIKDLQDHCDIRRSVKLGCLIEKK